METLLSYFCCIEGDKKHIKEPLETLSSCLWDPLHEDAFPVKHLNANQDTKTRRKQRVMRNCKQGCWFEEPFPFQGRKEVT